MPQWWALGNLQFGVGIIHTVVNTYPGSWLARVSVWFLRTASAKGSERLRFLDSPDRVCSPLVQRKGPGQGPRWGWRGSGLSRPSLLRSGRALGREGLSLSSGLRASAGLSSRSAESELVTAGSQRCPAPLSG